MPPARHILSLILAVGFWTGALGAATDPAYTPAPFRDHERWAVLGDSITHTGSYHRYVELFYATRFPARPLDVVNCGVAGDTAPGALRRLGWDCLDARPTVVTVMFGMNDVGRHLYAADPAPPDVVAKRLERTAAYERALRELTASLLRSGARVILILPSPFDDTADLPQPNSPGCGAALAGLARRAQAVADELKVATVDFGAPLAAINARQQSRDPHFTIIGPDRVHPGAPGHLVMAYEFLRAQNLSGPVSRIEIDAAAHRAAATDNCAVTDVRPTADGLTFTCLARSLPFPVELAAAPALAWIPLETEFNQETLLVRGLAEGDYELSIDDQPVRSFSASSLAAGVNLAREPATPQMQQALAVLTALKKKWDATAELRTLAYVEHGTWPDATRPVDAALMSEKVAARLAAAGPKSNSWITAQLKKYLDVKPREAALRAEAQSAVELARRLGAPRPHHYTLRRLTADTTR